MPRPICRGEMLGPRGSWPTTALSCLLGLLALDLTACRRVKPPIVCQGKPLSGAPRYPLRREGACLVDASGASFRIHGEAAWSLIVRLTPSEVDLYLADRQSRGVNTLLVNLIEHKFGGPRNRAGDLPFASPGDFTTPSEAYFEHADWVLRRAGEHGMLVLLAPAYLGFEGTDEGWYREVKRNGPARMREYGRFLGKRYRDSHNLIWIESGDMPPRDAATEVDALVAGIRELDRVHLHTAHSGGRRSAADDYARPWLDVNTTYGDCTHAARLLLRDGAEGGGRPWFFIEGKYEHEEASEGCLIAQAYYSLLLGSQGQVFGNRPIWLFDPGWNDNLASPGSTYMEHLAGLLRSRTLRAPVPDVDRHIVVEGGGRPDKPNYIAAARADSGRTVLVFVPEGPRSFVVDLSQVKGTRATGWWYDAKSGAAGLAGDYPTRGKQVFHAPAGPSLLVLDDADSEAGKTAPGLRPEIR